MTSSAELDEAIRRAIAEDDRIPVEKVTNALVKKVRREVEDSVDWRKTSQAAEATMSKVERLFKASLKSGLR